MKRGEVSLNPKLNALAQHRVLTLQAALDMLNEVFGDIENGLQKPDIVLAGYVHGAKERVERAIERIMNPDLGICLECGQGKNYCVCGESAFPGLASGADPK